jgi:hypothetical protein
MVGAAEAAGWEFGGTIAGHLVVRERQIGGFFEELLDLGFEPA